VNSPTNGLQNEKTIFEHFSNYLICRVTPVAFVTTKQQKAGLIPAKFPHETFLFLSDN
jgi:hypothetical protein